MDLDLGLPAHPSTDARVAMCAGFLTPTEGETLKGIGTRLSLVDRPPTAAALQELMVALKQPSQSGSIEAVAYSLTSDPLELARALEDVIPLSGQEGAAVARLRPANLLFHWEDETRSPANRGSAIGALASLSLSRDAAQKMRALAAALVEDHLEGLAERARSVGYYREAKAIAQDERGDPLLLIYLEMVDLHVHKRIMAYPDTEFTRWWGPRFQEIVRGNPMAGPADTVIRYTRLDQRSMNETPAGPT